MVKFCKHDLIIILIESQNVILYKVLMPNLQSNYKLIILGKFERNKQARVHY